MKLRILIATIMLLAGILTFGRVSAQESASGSSIAERCGLTQNYLKNIQKKRDLRARVDRLQTYQYIQQRLEIFITRLEKNGQPQSVELRAKLGEMENRVSRFKRSYETYDKIRDQLALQKDCKESTGLFQQKLDELRASRQTVHEDVVAINNLISGDIQSELSTLQEKLRVAREEQS